MNENWPIQFQANFVGPELWWSSRFIWERTDPLRSWVAPGSSVTQFTTCLLFHLCLSVRSYRFLGFSWGFFQVLSSLCHSWWACWCVIYHCCTMNYLKTSWLKPLPSFRNLGVLSWVLCFRSPTGCNQGVVLGWCLTWKLLTGSRSTS